MIKGTVKWFNDVKGYGFIYGEDKKDYFVHATNIITTGPKRLEENQKVEFEIEEEEKGPKAVNVVLF